MSKKVMLPPFDENLEQAVLGAILIEKDAIIKVHKQFSPEIFYKEENSLIAEAILKLYSEYRKIDLMTVMNELMKVGKLDAVGGPFYLTGLTDRVVSSFHIEDHIEIIKSHYIARKQIEIYQTKSKDLYDRRDAYDVSNEVSGALIALQEDSYSENEYSMADLARKSIDKREKNGNKKIEFIGYSTGIKALDRALLGIKEPDLTIIAGRPAMGKTAVALTLAKNLASQVPVTIFSLEMSAEQLYGRLLSSESNIQSKKIKTNDLSQREREYLTYADQALSKENIYINDTPAINIDKFRSVAMIHKRKYNTGVIIIDYLGLMKGNTKGQGNSTAEVTEITNKLKRVAKELKIPIIALAQLNRGVESRKEEMYRPRLADLRDSGSIEQDADNIIFLWRPEYYGLKEPITIREYSRDFLPEKFLMFIIAKCRDGETKNVPSEIDLSKMQIKDHPDIAYLFVNQKDELPF